MTPATTDNAGARTTQCRRHLLACGLWVVLVGLDWMGNRVPLRSDRPRGINRVITVIEKV